MKILNVGSSLNMTIQFSQSYKSTAKIIALRGLIFTFLGKIRETSYIMNGMVARFNLLSIFLK
jgi:hypothetical protein